MITKTSHFLMAAALASTSSVVMSATAEEACKNMTNKLSVLYEFYGYPKTFYQNEKKRISPIKTAEQLVSAAYSTTKWDLDKQWPGFFDWSSVTVLQALAESRVPSHFRRDSLSACIARYE